MRRCELVWGVLLWCRFARQGVQAVMQSSMYMPMRNINPHLQADHLKSNSSVIEDQEVRCVLG